MGPPAVRFDHLGVAVADLDAALDFYVRVLGMRADAIELHSDLGLRIARVHLAGSTIELIEAQDWERTTQRHLDHRGPGVYHLGVEVSDVSQSVDELNASSVPLVDQTPRGNETMLVAFVHPDAVGGMLVELVTHRRGD